MTPLDRGFWHRHRDDRGSGDFDLTFISGLLGIGVAGALWAVLQLSEQLQPLALPTSLAAGVATFAGYIGGAYSRYDRDASFRAECFQQIEASLRDECHVSTALPDSAAQLQARIVEAARDGRDSSALERALTAVRAAVAAEEERAAQARLVQCRIDMIRWQNQLEPVVLDRAGIGDVSEWQRRVDRVRELRSEGEGHRRRLEEDAAMRDLPEGTRLLSAWAELLRGCSRLEDELLAQQALCAVEAVQPLHEGLVDRSLAHAALDSESALRHVLITHDFGDLELAVADLRAQQSRIHAEREPAEELVRVGTRTS